MAMKIGSTYHFDEVQIRHWEQFATECDLSPPQVQKRLVNLAQKLIEETKTLASIFNEPIIQNIADLITKRCTRTLGELTRS